MEMGIAVDNPKSLLVSALMELSRHDPERLRLITEEEFIRKTNCGDAMEGVSFNAIIDEVGKMMGAFGLNRPDEKRFGKGRYLVIGDSHGKHTRRKMFTLLDNLNEHLKFDQIIHIGHLVDDDNDISCCWKDFSNLTVVACVEETKEIQRHSEEGYIFDVVRKAVWLGKAKVMNQDMISDYVKTGIDTIQAKLCGNVTAIVNSHRHEMDTRCTYNRQSFIASPGCLCEKHIVKTIKQIDFTSGYQVKEARPEGHRKYRRMKHLYEYWEQGFIIVEVDEKGDFSIMPLRIKMVGEEFTTAVYDKIYSGSQVFNPELKVFINSDIHCDLHDANALDIQDQVVKTFKPDVYVNLGDMQNNAALNHHDMDKGNFIKKNILDETASVHHILSRMARWADEKYFLFGNHERFAEDFYKRFPQFKEMFDTMLLSPLEENGYSVIDLKGVLELGDACFIHGDMKMYGAQGGAFLLKVANTFQRDVIIGHLHFSGIKQGAYVVGLSGKYEQGYNEPNATKWVHGFATCLQWQGVPFFTCVSIRNSELIYNGVKYRPVDPSSWQTPSYKPEIRFKFS